MMKVLIAEDDPVSKRLLEASLVSWGYEVIATNNGSEALDVLQGLDGPMLAILDIMMPEMTGIEVCRRVRAIPTSTPTYIILLTAKGGKDDIVAGLNAGADDYLTKPFERNELRARIEVGARVVTLQQKLAEKVEELSGTIVELREAELEIRNLSMRDELTNLYNLRGFRALFEQHRSLSRRSVTSFGLIYGDVDGLKMINDVYGHHEGSEALRQFADIFNRSFRDSDIIARIGGDEFLILSTTDCDCNTTIPLARLQENLSNYNARKPKPYQLSMSLGSICVNPENESTLEELLIKADRVMYENKRQKKEKLQLKLIREPAFVI